MTKPKIKFFQNVNVVRIEQEVNEFIKREEILDAQIFPPANMQVGMGALFTVMIAYHENEDEKSINLEN